MSHQLALLDKNICNVQWPIDANDEMKHKVVELC